MDAELVHFDESLPAWERAFYAFLAEKERRSGSMRTVDAYSRTLQRFFGTLGKPPDQVSSQNVFAFAHDQGHGRSSRHLHSALSKSMITPVCVHFAPLPPPHLKQPHRLIEPLQLPLSDVGEQEVLALDQLPDDIGRRVRRSGGLPLPDCPAYTVRLSTAACVILSGHPACRRRHACSRRPDQGLAAIPPCPRPPSPPDSPLIRGTAYGGRQPFSLDVSLQCSQRVGAPMVFDAVI